MATATGVTGLIPTYASIGIWAPILLLVCRMMQGFSTGGEWGGAAAFLVEYSPVGKRGITGSWQQFSTQIGSLAGSTAATVLATGLSETAFYSWGWRLPFLFGFLLGPIGYYLRRKVAETPVFTDTVERRKVERAPLRVAIRDYGDRMIKAFGLSHHRLYRRLRIHGLSRQLRDQHDEASHGRGTILRHGVRRDRGDADAVLRRIVRSDRAQAADSGMRDAQSPVRLPVVPAGDPWSVAWFSSAGTGSERGVPVYVYRHNSLDFGRDVSDARTLYGTLGQLRVCRDAVRRFRTTHLYMAREGHRQSVLRRRST